MERALNLLMSFAIFWAMRPLPLQSNKDHRRILEAILDQNAELAQSIHKVHRIAAKERSLRF